MKHRAPAPASRFHRLRKVCELRQGDVLQRLRAAEAQELVGHHLDAGRPGEGGPGRVGSGGVGWGGPGMGRGEMGWE